MVSYYFDITPKYGDRRMVKTLIIETNGKLMKWLTANGPFHAHNGIIVKCSVNYELPKFRRNTLYLSYDTQISGFNISRVHAVVRNNITDAMKDLYDRVEMNAL